MNEKGTAEVCPECGFKEGDLPESPLFLPVRTILNGRYLIGRVLGHGGFGITYLAVDLSLQNKVAVKEFLPQHLASRTPGRATVTVYSGDAKEHFAYGLEQFMEEARTLAVFSEHPGIVSVSDFFKANGTAYLVMSYLDGITLKDYLRQKGGRVPYETALRIMMPIMDVLREIHGAGMIHRDISPDNIYITRKKLVKLLDFGAARHAVNEKSRSISIMLKPGFSPEEQYRSKGKQGAWTDVYAVAATLYAAITGQTPPDALDRAEEDTLAAPSVLGADIPAAAESALLRAMSVKAADRTQSIDELQKGLAADGLIVLPNEDRSSSQGLRIGNEERPVRGRKKEDPTSNIQRSRLMRARTYLAWGMAGLAAVLIVLLVTWTWPKWGQKEKDQVQLRSQTEEAVADVTIPSVVRLSALEAERVLARRHLRIVRKYAKDEGPSQGVVIRQYPQGGARVKRDTQVELVISAVSDRRSVPSDEERVVIPSVIGISFEEARKTLESAGFGVRKIGVYRESEPSGTVVAQIPASDSGASDRITVTLEVSLGPKEEKPFDQELLRYRNVKYQFLLDHPEDWARMYGVKDTVLTLQDKNDETARIEIAVLDADGQSFLQTLDSSEIDRRVQWLAGSVDSSARIVRIDRQASLGGKPACRIKLSLTGAVTGSAELVYTVHENQIYLLVYLADAETYSRDYAEAQQVFRSFQFTE